MSEGRSPLLDRLQAIEEEGLAALREAADLDDLEAERVRYLGRSGAVADILGRIGSIPAEERRPVGQRGNAVKRLLEGAYEARAGELRREERARAVDDEDLTLPGRRAWPGGSHPVTVIIDEICDIFAELGFTRVTGPEVETEWYNFTALNIPLDHPAADVHDTFYVEDGVVLRTHTSPVQARTMQAYQPPVRVVVPGTCYRRESIDASHAAVFDQIEGLAVDEGVDFVEFRAAIEYFVHRFFGPDTATRFRPDFFPFTEPSAQVEVSCTICGGGGCPTCKGTGWIEIMGSGMVDPAVFEAVGYDPERYTGYAFGMGPGRMALLRHRIPDLRLLHEGDVRFLRQFAGA